MKRRKKNTAERKPAARTPDVFYSKADLKILEDVRGPVVFDEFDLDNAVSAAINDRGRKQRPPVELPGTWEEIKRFGSISQRQAAEWMGRSTKTIQRLFKDRRLTKTPKKRVVCNDFLRNELRKVHGTHVLR